MSSSIAAALCKATKSQKALSELEPELKKGCLEQPFLF